MDIKKELVEKLEKDCEIILNQKLPRALADNNDGTYRNLVKALDSNLELIEKYNPMKDVTIKKMLDLDFYNSKDEFVFRIPCLDSVNMVDNIEYLELSGICNFPVFSFNDTKCIYKVKGRIELKDIFSDYMGIGDVILSNVQIISNETINPKISLKILRINNEAPFIFTVEVK